MAVSSQDVVNQAIQYIGDNQPLVTGTAPNFDNSPAGIAAAKLYGPVVATVAQQHGWDFARRTVALTVTGNTAPFPWTFEYGYPANGIQVWQLTPATLADRNNPRPVTWSIGNAVVSGSQARVIWSNQATPLAVFNNNPNENTWTPLFREAVARLLASEMAMALTGKPDLSQSLLETGGAFESLAEGRTS